MSYELAFLIHSNCLPGIDDLSPTSRNLLRGRSDQQTACMHVCMSGCQLTVHQTCNVPLSIPFEIKTIRGCRPHACGITVTGIYQQQMGILSAYVNPGSIYMDILMAHTFASLRPPQCIRDQVWLRVVQLTQHPKDIVNGKHSIIISIQYPSVAVQSCTSHTYVTSRQAVRSSQ